MAEEKNIFDKMEAEGEQEEIKQPVKSASSTGEYDYENLSNVPVGQQKKYTRQDLDGKTVKVLKASLFGATADDDEITALSNSSVKYKKARFIITYDTKNAEGMNDREYYSGVIQFVQRDGSLSEPKFWNEDADNQSAHLWEIVAKKKEVKPEELSPREFLAFLNSGINVKIAGTEVKYKKETYKKNLIVEIL